MDSETRNHKHWLQDRTVQWIFVCVGTLWAIAAVFYFDHRRRQQDAQAAAMQAAALKASEELMQTKAAEAAAEAAEAAAEKRAQRETENQALGITASKFQLLERDIQANPAGDNILEVYAYDGELTEKMTRDLCIIRSRAMKTHGAVFFELVVFRKPGNYAKSKTPVPAAYAHSQQEFLRSFMRIHFSSRIDYNKGDVSWSTESLRGEYNRLEIVFDE